ncbi:mitochondrial calcium uptake 3 isoform X2 [Haemaphysalis longicornis]
MATPILRRGLLQLIEKNVARQPSRCISQKRIVQQTLRFGVPVSVIASASMAAYLLASKRRLTVQAKRPTKEARDAAIREYREEAEHTMHLTQRERRFIRFASVEYDGQLYMTPEDFLESLTESEPRPRLHRRQLTKKELEHMVDQTPARKYGSTKLFRDLRERGIISYTEYLFLLSVLTKPQSGFRIAFNMFDTDGNQRVDKQEFLVVLQILVAALFFKKSGKLGLFDDVPPDVEESEGKDFHSVDTTLLVHLFGRKGTDTLRYDDFHRFMDNLQTEVLELEFTEFSRGMPTISEVDFARILLRYTYIHSANYEAYIDRVMDRIPEEKGITFDQFKAFCQFLNNLDDFSIAMRMFTYANKPISQEEFHRAVKICTGHSLDPHLVDTVFQIFDSDGDGFLSYKEFIAIMRDRLHRGLRSHLISSEGWDAFKLCIKEEIRSH